MNTYVSTFITGFGDIVSESLKKELPDVEVSLMLDGLVVYRSKASIEKVYNFDFVNNSFILLKQFNGLSVDQVEEMMRAVIKDSQAIKAISNYISKNNSFRVVTSLENQTIPVNKNLLDVLEVKVEELVGLTVDRKNPDTELWFSSRNAGYGFFMLRLTSKAKYKNPLEELA